MFGHASLSQTSPHDIRVSTLADRPAQGVNDPLSSRAIALRHGKLEVRRNEDGTVFNLHQKVGGSRSTHSISHYNYDGTELSCPGWITMRFYHPLLGRFIQEDPIRLYGGDFNLYRYVGNNPGNFTDPIGTTAALEQGPFDANIALVETLCDLASAWEIFGVAW